MDWHLRENWVQVFQRSAAYLADPCAQIAAEVGLTNVYVAQASLKLDQQCGLDAATVCNHLDPLSFGSNPT